MNNWIMCLNDGEEVAELSYEPDVFDIIRIDETDKFYEVTHKNNTQNWCLCKEMRNSTLAI